MSFASKALKRSTLDEVNLYECGSQAIFYEGKLLSRSLMNTRIAQGPAQYYKNPFDPEFSMCEIKTIYKINSWFNILVHHRDLVFSNLLQ